MYCHGDEYARESGSLQVDCPAERHPGGAAGYSGRVDHDHRDARHLPRHPSRPACPRELVLSAVDDPRVSRRDERPHRQPRTTGGHGRAGQDLPAWLRDLHGRVAPARRRLDVRPRRRDLPDRAAPRAGCRRRLPAGERGGDHHRRVPRQPARDGPGHQQHRRRQRLLHRPRARRRARADQLAAGVPDLGAGRDLRNRLGLPQPA